MRGVILGVSYIHIIRILQLRGGSIQGLALRAGLRAKDVCRLNPKPQALKPQTLNPKP